MSSPYSFLWMRFTSWTRRSFNVLWLVVLASYFLVLAGRSIYQNYQDQQQTVTLEKQEVTAQQEDKRLQALVVYYQSDSYKEQELRRDLLLQMPGEKVYALPESGIVSPTNDSTPDTTTTKPDTRPLWQQWVSYLLHRS